MPSQFELDWDLFLAVRKNDLNKANDLLAAGANPNFEDPQDAHRNPDCIPTTTLYRAINCQHKAFVALLLEHGATIPDAEKAQIKLGEGAMATSKPIYLLMLLEHGLPPRKEYRDWAAGKRNRKLKKLLNDSYGQFKINYDIEALLTLPTHEFYEAFYNAVPEYFDPNEKILSKEERVIRDIYEFETDIGSGFSSMYSNEHFDTFNRAYRAVSVLGNNLALSALAEFRTILKRYRFPLRSKGDERRYARLSESDHDALETEIETLDSKYFHGEESMSLWQQDDYLQLGVEYVKKNIGVFQKRRG